MADLSGTATGATIGATVGGVPGALVGAGIGLVADIASNWGNWFPGDIEKAYKASAMDDLERLQGGAGGMSPAKKQEAQSMALGQIEAEVQQAEAQMQRTPASGAQGQAFAAQNALQKAKMGAQQQAMSSIRSQDLEEAQRQRQEAYQKAAMAESMRQTRKSGAPGMQTTMQHADQFGQEWRSWKEGQAADIAKGDSSVWQNNGYTAPKTMPAPSAAQTSNPWSFYEDGKLVSP